MRAAALLILGGLLALASPALAQERTPAQRQTLVDIAYVLGESHALRQVCEGAYDQYWRDRMIGVTDTEQPDAALDRRMKEAFNSGFAARRTEYPQCTRASRITEAAVARRGQNLASQMGRVAHRLDPREAEARRQTLELAPPISP